MTTGWPRNQEDLRWPHSDSDETGPGSQAGGRVATDSDRASAAGGFGTEHPSGPLPITPAAQPRSRFGRRSRDSELDELRPEEGADADYDWIKYLGEAGPAQEHSRRSADAGPDDKRERGSRASGRRFGRRAQADDAPKDDTQASSPPAPQLPQAPAPALQASVVPATRPGRPTRDHDWRAKDYPVPDAAPSVSRGGSPADRQAPGPRRAPGRPGPASGPADQGFGTSAADSTSIFSADPGAGARSTGAWPADGAVRPERTARPDYQAPAATEQAVGRIPAPRTGPADRNRPSGRIATSGPSNLLRGPSILPGLSGRSPIPGRPDRRKFARPGRTLPRRPRGRRPQAIPGPCRMLLLRCAAGLPGPRSLPMSGQQQITMSVLACVGAYRTAADGQNRVRLRPTMPTAGTGRAPDAPAWRR